MKRRRGPSATKARRRKPVATKRQPQASRHRSGRQSQANERLIRERDEALEQQTAAADVLKAISSSTFDLQTILDTLVETAARLCHAKLGLLFRRDGKLYWGAAFYGYSPEFKAFYATHPIAPGRGTTIGRTALEGKTVHIPDVLADSEYKFLEAQKIGQYRANLGVPLLRAGESIGALSLARSEPEPFTARQIELVESFAAQAVIAIENTRLLNELRESLQQQTATADVLKVISSSPGELDPVFEAMLASATQICGAEFGLLYRSEGELFRTVSLFGAPSAFAEQRRLNPMLRPSAGTALGRVVATKEMVQIPDVRAEPAYQSDPLRRASFLELAGARTVVCVPMLKDNEIVGAISIYRQEVRPFTDKQIELLKNFAAQSVIAIENTRLLGELRESLQQQTATADVLKVISSSPGDLEPVFLAMLEKAMQLCEAKFGIMFRFADGVFRATSWQGNPPAHIIERPHVVSENPHNLLTRVVSTKQPVHSSDLTKEKAYIEGNPRYRALVETVGARSLLVVPMLKNNELIGAIAIYWQEARSFTEKQMELISNFAAQAVIAIDNARLLTELRESLQQQTATADVLKVISRSTFDLQTVLDTLAESATRLCDAKNSFIFLRKGDLYHVAARHGFSSQFHEYLEQNPRPADRGSITGRTALEAKVVHVSDVMADPEYAWGAAQQLGGYRTVLGVPLLRDGSPVGVIIVGRTVVQPFTEKQIELVTTFADQAVIAIENARLFDEVQARTRDLSESLEQQTATSEVLKVISSSPGELEPVFEAMLANAVRICGAKFGNLFLREGDGLRAVAFHGAPQAYVEERRRNPVLHPNPATTLGRAMATKQPVQIADIQAYEPDTIDAASGTTGVKLAKLAGARTVLAVPMVKESELVGAVVIYRREVLPFTDKQIDLVQNFGAQAVIAVENTRLLNELRESLQQQTATADVLKVISSSPGDLEPVFDALLTNAMQVCDAKFGFMYRASDTDMKIMAHKCDVPAYLEFAQKARFTPQTIVGRVAETKQVIQVVDIAATQRYADREPLAVAAVEIGRVRTILGVPLLKETEVKGAILLYRQEVRPFTDKQIELVKNFAAQAVIAIENARLLNELRQRTDALSEALEQQTATSEVLRVISSSPTNVQPVFDAIAESAVRLCDGQFSFVVRFDGKVMDFASCYGLSAGGLDAFHSILPMPASEYTAAGRAIVRRAVVEISDVETDPSYGAQAQGLAKAVIYRSIAAVPLLNEGNPIGAIAVARANAGSFPKRQIVLLQAFADQAVIAIANVRLFDEVQARTRELAKSLDDLRTTQDRLVQTQKLASLGQLTAGIAHEIKNPLNFVNNFSVVSAELIDELQDILKRVSVDDKTGAEIKELTETLQGNLDKVVQHGKRADAIVKNMLLHSREGSGEHRPVDINALVEESLNLAYHGARAEKQGFNITLERSLDPAAGQADVFPQDITRVLLNLISNGFYAATKRKAQADGDGYEPTLAAGTRSLGDRVEISVRDNGMGIPPEVKEKMFNPFFTTKPAGEGTGLGLSISHDIIVKQHGGSIEVDTQPGAFTEIKIILPRAAVFLVESAGSA